MFLKRKEHVTQLHRDSTALVDIYNREWEQMIEDFAYQAIHEIEPDTRSSDYVRLMESLITTLNLYQEYHFPKQNITTDEMDQIMVDDLFNYDTTLFRTEKSALAHSLAGVQMYLMNEIFYSPLLLQSMYHLQEIYPDSQLLKHYDPLVEKLENYLKASQETFNGGKITRRKYDTFDELLSRFEGENVLVDIWATWCHPCVKEFEHKDKLQPLVENGEITFLYISVDKPEWADRWKSNIKYNQLEGHHYRADLDFKVDMWDKLGGDRGAIPRYVLIDKSGELFLSTAARPSEEDALVSQINEMTSQ